PASARDPLRRRRQARPVFTGSLARGHRAYAGRARWRTNAQGGRAGTARGVTVRTVPNLSFLVPRSEFWVRVPVLCSVLCSSLVIGSDRVQVPVQFLQPRTEQRT